MQYVSSVLGILEIQSVDGELFITTVVGGVSSNTLRLITRNRVA